MAKVLAERWAPIRSSAEAEILGKLRVQRTWVGGFDGWSSGLRFRFRDGLCGTANSSEVVSPGDWAEGVGVTKERGGARSDGSASGTSRSLRKAVVSLLILFAAACLGDGGVMVVLLAERGRVAAVGV